ncbi:MAG: hypothetical protein ACI865_001211 [Flavobacteriaceae bacterium]|jgi:hypothetical protein
MIRLLIILMLPLCFSFAYAQDEISLYDGAAHRRDVKKIKKVFQWSVKEKANGPELDKFIREKILNGQNAAQDSVAFLAIKHNYYYETKDVVNEMHAKDR